MATKSRFAARAKTRQRARARKPSRATRRAGSIREPAGPILRYQVAVQIWADAFAKAVNAAIVPELERFGRQPAERKDAADGGGPPPNARAAKAVVAGARARIKGAPRRVGAAAEIVAERTVQHSQGEFKRLGIKLREAEPKLGKLIDGWRAENVDKITTLGERELDTIESILANGEGRRVESLAKEIAQRCDVTASKARMLATDQVLTLNAQIAQSRMRAAGIMRGIWTTAGDERVRDSHAEIDGVEFDLDDPPEVDGENVLPGEPPMCRCTTFPQLPELADDEDDQQAQAAE